MDMYKEEVKIEFERREREKKSLFVYLSIEKTFDETC